MTEDELLKRFGLAPSADVLDDIREILATATAREESRQGDGNTELMKLCCVQLFSAAHLSDVRMVWEAKCSSFDATCSIDVQLLCGAGLSETKDFLKDQSDSAAGAALAYIIKCEASGDFVDFSPNEAFESYEHYYGVSPLRGD